MPLSCLAPCIREPSPEASAPPGRRRATKPAAVSVVAGPPVDAAAVTAVDHLENLPRSKARVAVLFNARARRVTPEVAGRLEKIVGRRHAFYSHNLDEARAHIAHIAAAKYDTLVCCGGDGTLITAMNMMRDCVAKRPDIGDMPRFAQLTLGTGNALRQVVGAGDPAADLRNIRAGNVHDRPLSLIEDHNGTAFFFGGVGHDARLMYDYDRMQTRVPICLSRNLMRSKLGFTTAMLSRTAPRMLIHPERARAVVVARGPCYRVDRKHGDKLVPLTAGQIFSGPIGMLGVSTVPWLGYDIRMFPFADTRPEMMHLRITQLSLLGMLTHSRALWRGTFNHPARCHDFLVSAVDVHLDHPLHYQHSGESQGRVQHLRFGVQPKAVKLAAQNRT